MYSNASVAATALTTPPPTRLLVGTDNTDPRLSAVATAFALRLGATVVSASAPATPDANTPDTVLCTQAGLQVADDLSAALERPGRSVLVVGPHCSVDVVLDGPVVVTFDGSARATSIFSTARSWAHALDVPILLAHMWDPLDPLDHGSEIFGAVRDALAMLGPSARFEPVRTSYPAGAIRELARDLDASFVAMSSLGSDAHQGIVIGRVAARVVREASCPILLRRPIDEDPQ